MGYVRFFETKISGTKTKVVTRKRACVYLLFSDDRHQVVLNSFQPKEQNKKSPFIEKKKNQTKQNETKIKSDVFQKKKKKNVTKNTHTKKTSFRSDYDND